MAGQPPVAIVSGGERQVDRRRHRPPAYGGGSPAPLSRRLACRACLLVARCFLGARETTD